MEDEDSLIEKCMNLQLSEKRKWYNNSMYELYCVEDTTGTPYVYTKDDIKDGSFIGYLEGDRKYTWELLPHKYCIWINDSYVIDCRETPRCIGAMIREGDEDEYILTTNCEIAYAYTSDEIKVYIRATRNIFAGEELIIKKDWLSDY